MRKYAAEQEKRKAAKTAGGTEGAGEAPDFPDWVDAHQKALRSYCHSLTGSAWEGDDLAQDTWLRVWSSLRNQGDRIRLTRAYLYKAARNTWIDRGRKKMLPAHPMVVEELPQQRLDETSVWAAMETLVSQLPPNQRTALLLVDVLQYTAAEAAQLIQSTEGAVKAALHRARTKLRNGLFQSREGEEQSKARAFSERQDDTGAHEAVVYAYLDAFRRQDASALAMLFNDPRPQDLVPTLTLQSYRRNAAAKPGTRTATPVRSQWMMAAAA
ncbi:RNA polymerase sigma factor [Paenibacillus macerans]|uniref:RNA polymerase sigma factor n=1 Tax=Paenibacillus macerans TaxID=44252 RepID=UPI002041FB87|nr:RNA polymerase sigma factor [Paenibacillus macerans]MCM3703583.1 RNA polymerase sigma factor [Paenibacillus macerans]